MPLDLGAGELKFNTSTARTSVRNTVPRSLYKGYFPDRLLRCICSRGAFNGYGTKNVARLTCKAYLTCLVENPNGIPMRAPRTDPMGRAQWYFQQAYVATTAIDDPGPYGLMPTFYELHVGGNERNKEMMFYADHTQSSEKYNGASLTYGSGGGADNFACWMMTWNYPEIRSHKNPELNSPASTVLREATQDLGRPLTRMAPTVDVYENIFVNKTEVSRFDASFTLFYRGKWPKAGYKTEFYYGANGMKVYPGDPILTFLPENPSTPIDYPEGPGPSNVGGGILPGRADFVISLDDISRVVYPGTWKLSTYRTDSGDGLGQPNAGITRPFNIAKFSEFYFIAAEAAVKGATVKPGKSARELINVIRARAGKWSFDRFNNVERDDDYSQEMMDATPLEIDIDYLLAESSREYYGEGSRWYDLCPYSEMDGSGFYHKKPRAQKVTITW